LGTAQHTNEYNKVLQNSYEINNLNVYIYKYMVHVSITKSVSKTKSKRMNSFLKGGNFVLGGALTCRH
jgi:hypothetical protein